MVACHDARLAAVVMGSPPACCKPTVEQLAVRPRIHRRLKSMGEICERFNLTPMNLSALHPAISPQNILLIEGIYDSLCLKDDVEDLWHKWGQPDIWRLPHGHVGICCGFAPGLPRRIIDWLKPRLNGATDRTLNKSAGGTARQAPPGLRSSRLSAGGHPRVMALRQALAHVRQKGYCDK